MLFRVVILFYIFGALVHSVPLCLETISTAGGGPPDSSLPAEISDDGINAIKLAAFLEQLEVSFFTKGSANISTWGTNGYSNITGEVVAKVAAVSLLPALTPCCLLTFL